MNPRLWMIVLGGLGIGVLGSTWSILNHDDGTSQIGQILGRRSTGERSDLTRPPIVAQPSITAEPLTIQARSAVVIDAGSGTVLLAKNEHQPVPIASTTKIMTAIVLLESGRNLSESATVSQAGASQIGSAMGLRSGESLTLIDLLAGLMIVSGNDAAYVIAESTGSVDAFVKRMNETAAEIGLNQTQYFDPAGLDDRGRSTPFDLATLFRYALTFDEFRQVANRAEQTVYSSAGNRYDLKNSNRLVRADQPLFMPDALGGKTGFTPDAGHCLIAAAKRDGHVLVSAVLHTDANTPEASAAESRRLLEWTFGHTRWTE